MPRQRSRTERRQIERANAQELGDDYKFTNDPKVAAERRKRRRERRDRELESYQAHNRDRWAKCIAPGCKFQTSKILHGSLGVEFPICSIHATAIWESVNVMIDEEWFGQSQAALKARRDSILLEQSERMAQVNAEAQAFIAASDALGDIYYTKVGDLIKVGWTSDLWSRMRAYGPDAELLVHYPATRNDEMCLHRQLTPSRAKGREWYHDDPIVRAFVSNAIRQHGRPEITDFGWTKPKQVVAGKRLKRGA